MKHDKGVAGLQIILSLVVMLFIIGLLVMIFVIMGAQMLDVSAVSSSTTATAVINDTMLSIDDVITWFPLYIVIGSMVVLILLTVIIITAIRSSGIMGEGSA